MRSAATLVLVTVAVIVQTAVVNRLPFDWVPGPDLVVAAVVAVALTTSPAAAAASGFAAGLAVDLLPPADHAVGRYALVLCLAAYTVALLRQNTGAPGGGGSHTSAWAALGATAVTALGVGTGYAAVGFVMGDAHITPAAVAVGIGAGAACTTLVAPLVTLPIVWVRDTLADSEFATVQGPMSPGGW